VTKRFTAVRTLNVVKVPAGATVTLTCTGPKHSCPFRRKRIHVAHFTTALKLTKLFRGHALKPGTRIEITVTERGMNGVDVRITTRRGSRPSLVRRTLPAG
jgi:hypothetical protein